MAALPAPHRPGADLASRRILIDPVRWRGAPRHLAPTSACSRRPSSPTGGCACATSTARTAASAPTPWIPTAWCTRPRVVPGGRPPRPPNLFRADRTGTPPCSTKPYQRPSVLELADVWDTLAPPHRRRPGPGARHGQRPAGNRWACSCASTRLTWPPRSPPARPPTAPRKSGCTSNGASAPCTRPSTPHVRPRYRGPRAGRTAPGPGPKAAETATLYAADANSRRHEPASEQLCQDGERGRVGSGQQYRVAPRRSAADDLQEGTMRAASPDEPE